VLAALVLAFGLYLAWRAFRRWQFNAPRRYAMSELARYEAEYTEHRDPVRLGRELSALLRRGMLAYAPRDAVAGLSRVLDVLELDGRGLRPGRRHQRKQRQREGQPHETHSPFPPALPKEAPCMVLHINSPKAHASSRPMLAERSI
jgi:ABC-type nickel/cobalt efflux system permease component RcnA